MGATTWTHAQDQIILDGLKADQTYSQIATQLGVSKSMVSGRLFRLRKNNCKLVPPVNAAFSHGKTPCLPKANTLPNDEIAQRNRRFHQHPWQGFKSTKGEGDGKSGMTSETKAKPKRSLKPKLRVIDIDKPDNPPRAFMELQRGQCSWPVEDELAPGGAHMMCCGADVMDAKKREGDRRSSYCAYHYALSIRPETPEKRDKKSA